MRCPSAKLTALIILAAFPASAWSQEAHVKLFKAGGDEVDWCRSSNRIAYAGRGPDNFYGIHTCSPSGGEDSWITKDNPRLPPGHKGSPTWHPSGRLILFVAEKAKHPGSHWECTPGIGSYSDLWVMKADGSQAWRLTDYPLDEDKGIIIPRFSHDGKRIVWAERVERARILNPKQICAFWDLKVADFGEGPNGPSLSNIKTIRPGGSKAFNESYGFTPDDRRIIFCSDYNQKSFWSSQIFTCDAASGGDIQQLTSANYNEHAFYTTDGSSLVWMTNAGGRKGTDWWMMNADGSAKRQITFFNRPGHPESSRQTRTCGLGAFSPDGHRFVGGVQDSLVKQTGSSYMVELSKPP